LQFSQAIGLKFVFELKKLAVKTLGNSRYENNLASYADNWSESQENPARKKLTIATIASLRKNNCT
jgi:hypothetical protein